MDLGPYRAVGRRIKHGVLARRAPTFGTVAIETTHGIACRNRSGTVEEGEGSNDLK